MKNFIPFVGVLIALLSLLSTENLSAQELTVVSFEARTTDLTAKTRQRKDLNGDAAALVRVQIAAPGVLFKGNIVGEVETGFGEYLVYMAKNSRHLRIYHKDYLFVPLDYEIPVKIESNCTYLLKLEVPVYTHYNQIMLDKRIKKPRPQYGFEQHIELFGKLSAKGYYEYYNTNHFYDGASYSYRKLKPVCVFGINWIGGRRFNNTFFLGGGIGGGAGYATGYYSEERYESDVNWYNYTEDEVYEHGYINAYVHSRVYLTKTKFQPFIAVSAGAAAHINAFGTFSPYLNPEIGFNYRIKDHFSIYLTGGYATYFNAYDSWQFKLGFTL